MLRLPGSGCRNVAWSWLAPEMERYRVDPACPMTPSKWELLRVG